jgi:hypothetical protein
MVDADGDGWWAGSDCNDSATNTFPGAGEICDGVDNDCDGSVDEGLTVTYYTDADADGFGEDGTEITGTCAQPLGTATQGGDCDDADDTVFPNAPELCDGIDNDCNGETDDNAGILYFTDADGDNYGDDVSAIFSCTPIPGALTVGGDCDDGDANINPGAADPCDAIDQDCSGGPVLTTWFQDNDGDGFGNPAVSLSDCAQPSGYAAQGGDCDDTNNTLFPGNGCNTCTPTDQQWLAVNQQALLNAMNGCALECLSGEPGCIGSCLQGAGIPVGTLCLTCVEDYISCTQTNCLIQCLGGEEACQECQLQSGCFATFASCLGMVDADGDGWWAGSDCDDSDPTVHPGATELCNGVDDDCDGQVDEGFPQEYADNDGDGFGNALQPLSCDTPGVANPDDCDDTNAAIFPGQGCGGCSPADIALVVSNTSPSQGCIQFCYGGAPNDLLTCLANCYVQAGFSNTCASCIVDFQFCTAVSCPECEQDPNSAACIQCRQNAGCDSTFTACSGLQDADGDGYFAPIDCNDANAAVHPNGVEGCTVDGLDNDCDGQVDEDALVDTDGDGFSLCDGDCNDMNADVTPVAAEVCDGIDNNCNGTTDEGFPAYFVDNDGDGFGDPVIAGACGAPGSVPNNLDCDDAAPTVYPGAPELCDELDNDCNGTVDDNLTEDLDNDGFTPCTGDCDDNNANVFPGAPELCDGIDNDCSGAIEPTLFADLDADGFGAAGIPVPCGTPGSPNQLDCDDSDPLVTLSPRWYPDADGDGYGVSGTTISACTQPTGYAGNSFDCDDNDPQVFPGQGCVECSPADLALMASDPGVISPSQFCSFSCASVPDQQQCLSACLAGNGLSDPCADCFAAYVFCQAATCPICLEQPQSPACIACQENNGCKEAFTACSGLEDADDDDFFVPFDCNDANAVVHPDAPELCDGLDNDCDGSVDEGCNVRISVKVLLEGPYDPGAGSMSDGMRALGLVPTTEPYTGLGYGHVGGGGESTSPALLATGGADAIVDWVLLELRAPEQPSVIVASRSALLQRDGQVVDVLGTGPVTMPIGAGSYHVAVRHRNHLGCMTDAPLALGPAGSSVDFSLGTTTTFGTNARKSITGAFPAQVLWAGDVTFNGNIQYTGPGNDRDPLLIQVGSTTPNNVVNNVYSNRDVNLNGNVQYTGAGNDRDPILVNVGSTAPNNIRTEQLP